MNELVEIQNVIYEIRGHKVMLDADLARLYGVPVKVLNQAVKRNIERFPSDFMFQLTDKEQLQVVTNCDHLKSLKFRPTLAYAFTEEGVAMLSGVLKSVKAVEVNIAIMRAFVQIRQYMIQSASPMQEIKELKQMLLLHIDNTDNRFNEHGERINQIIRVLNNLIEHPKPKRKIGFM
jgi:hypothetical protein